MNGPVKVCHGPAHHGPTRIPLDREHWYFHGNAAWAQSKGMVGKPITPCIECHRVQALSRYRGFVPTSKLRVYAVELVDRCGSRAEAYRRSGISHDTLIRLMVDRPGDRVLHRTATRLLQALAEQRKYDRRNGTSRRFVEARKAQARIEERLQRDGCG